MTEIRNYDLLEIFKDTLTKSQILYQDATDTLVDQDTIVYTEHIDDTLVDRKAGKMRLKVVNAGTVETGRKLIRKGKTAILNFADALVPGGLVWAGATTQEENICRCSNLYASISSDKARELYYDVNGKDIGQTRYGVYTDNIIYSRDVLFFKDDTYYKKVRPYCMDVITCPAPSCKLPSNNEFDVTYTRVCEILKSAAINDVKNIVLGAWGCGAFGQNPYIVSACFKRALAEYPVFDNVVFAIRSCEADYDKTTNFRVFKTTFRG